MFSLLQSLADGEEPRRTESKLKGFHAIKDKKGVKGRKREGGRGKSVT